MHMRTWLHLQAQLREAGQTLEQATTAQQQRDKQLTQTLAQLNSLKASVKSQEDILKTLPDVLTLPKPLMPAANYDSGLSTSRSTGSPKPEAPQPQPIAIPSEDLKPPYDFALDCKACQARLFAVAADLADEKNKTQVLSRERDAALQVARGGSLRQRIKRSAKWFLFGVVAGAVAAKAR